MKRSGTLRTIALILTFVLLSLTACSAEQTPPEQNPYRQAVNRNYTGTEDAFYTSLAMETLGQGSAYEDAVGLGYTGTQSQWLTTLVGQTVETADPNATAYHLAVENGYSGSAEQWLNDLPKEQKDLSITLKSMSPSFAWIDDDGRSFVYSDLYPWAVEHQVPFTAAVITKMPTGRITQEQITQMYESGLVDIASHSQTHNRLSTVSDEQLPIEIINSKETIESWGIPCDIMVYPYGDVDQRGIDLVQQHYDYGFIAGGPQNSAGIHTGNRVNYPPVDTYRIKRIAIAGGMSQKELNWIKTQIDQACANNGLIVFMSHIGITPSVSPAQDLAVYTEIVEYIRSKGHDIEPVDQVMDRFSNLVEIGGWANYKPEHYLVVGADGTVRLDNLNGQVVLPDNSYTNASTPNSYPQNQVTTCYISGGSAGTGLPGGGRGILTAYLVGSTGYRTYMPAVSTDLYVQIRSSDKDQWKAWTKVNSNVTSMLSNNKINHTTLPSALPSGVSMCIVTNADALNALPGDGKAGYLTNYKISTNSANVRQEWQPFDSLTTYIRLADSGVRWGSWYKLEPVPVEE